MSKGEREWARRDAEGLPQKPRKWPYVLAVLLCATAGYGLYQYLTTSPVVVSAPLSTTATVLQISSIEMARIKPQVLQQSVKVIGTLSPVRQSQLSAQVNGRVEEVRVKPGDKVQAGDVLVQVDTETLTLELDQMKSTAAATAAQLSLAETKLERVKALSARNIATSAMLDEADSSARGLRASVSALQDQTLGAELRLRNATIVAPFDGIISARAVEPGQYVGIGAPLVTLVDLTSVEMQANAAIAAGPLLAPGQNVSISVDGVAGRIFEGKVTRINPVAEQGTRTIPVYILIENEDQTLLGGMFATGQIVVREVMDALAVPKVALRENAKGKSLLVIEDGRLWERSVEVSGDWAGGLTWVTSGIKPGEDVITAPLAELKDGDAIQIVED